MATTGGPTPSGLPWWVWILLFCALGFWVAHRMDVFDIWTVVAMVDGQQVRMPDGYATVDHPFHTTRAETLRRALPDGELLRWIGHHQGGYPVEFYPLGVAMVEVVLWALAFGALPMAIIHKITVALIFLLPAVPFALLARHDRLSPGVALVATTAHLVVNGWWWSGGYMELVQWGLVTNVAAHVMLLFVLAGLVEFLRSGFPRAAALAAGSAAFAILSNPRTLIALVVIGVGAVLAAAWDAGGWSRLRPILGRLASVAGVSGLLAAPELLSLVRFSDLYFFVRYSRYEGVEDFMGAWVQSVSGPVFIIAVVGFIVALFGQEKPHARAAAVTLALYAGMTAILSIEAWSGRVVEQLELTRLMPFQRLLTIYLAAIGVWQVLGWMAGAYRRRTRLPVELGLTAIAGLLVIFYVVAPPSFIPESDRGLYEIPSAATPEIADLRQAVQLADQAAGAGTAVLVLGTTVSWHDQLWAPLWSDRPFFYDDWLWYWQTRHFGAYDSLREHVYPVAATAIEHAYLDSHGIGAVVVTGPAKVDAALSPLLDLIRTGHYDVYTVRQPTTVVSSDAGNAISSEILPQQVEAEVTSDGGSARIRRNWFPRWRATVNGADAPIAQTDDGYMTVPIPSGQARIELTYAVDGWDWLARLAALGGCLTMVWLVMPASPRRKLWARASSRAQSALR